MYLISGCHSLPWLPFLVVAVDFSRGYRCCGYLFPCLPSSCLPFLEVVVIVVAVVDFLVVALAFYRGCRCRDYLFSWLPLPCLTLFAVLPFPVLSVAVLTFSLRGCRWLSFLWLSFSWFALAFSRGCRCRGCRCHGCHCRDNLFSWLSLPWSCFLVVALAVDCRACLFSSCLPLPWLCFVLWLSRLAFLVAIVVLVGVVLTLCLCHCCYGSYHTCW